MAAPFYASQLRGARFNNNSCAKSTFHRFVWNRPECHSSTCVICTSILCTLFRHECHMHIILFKRGCCMSICVVYTRKLCTQFPCLKNAWHSCLNNTNLWNNRFHMDLEWTHEPYEFVMWFFLLLLLLWL